MAESAWGQDDDVDGEEGLGGDGRLIIDLTFNSP